MMPADDLAAIRARLALLHPLPASVAFMFNHEEQLMRQDVPALLVAHDALVAENARLRAGIAGLRREHDTFENDCWYACPKSGACYDDDRDPDYCTCGADRQNAAIDALLKGDT